QALEGVACFADPDAALRHAQEQGHRRLYGIGGERIFAAMLPIADRLLITEVDVEVPGADAHFPAFNETDWQRIGSTGLRAENPRCELVGYLRRTTLKETR